MVVVAAAPRRLQGGGSQATLKFASPAKLAPLTQHRGRCRQRTHPRLDPAAAPNRRFGLHAALEPNRRYHAAQLSPNGVIATAAEGDAPLLALPSSLLPGANVDGWAGQPGPPPASPLPLVVAFVTGVAVAIAASRLAQGRARRASSDRLRRAHGVWRAGGADREAARTYLCSGTTIGAPLLSESTGSYAYGEPAPLPATQRG